MAHGSEERYFKVTQPDEQLALGVAIKDQPFPEGIEEVKLAPLPKIVEMPGVQSITTPTPLPPAVTTCHICTYSAGIGLGCLGGAFVSNQLACAIPAIPLVTCGAVGLALAFCGVKTYQSCTQADRSEEDHGYRRLN
jgi:hypothetical protein